MSLNMEQTQDPAASWSNLPRKGQLCVLALCRVYDFMQIASFQTICYYQLKSFDASLSEDRLSWETGIASSSFSAAQIFTAVMWGRIADAKWGGRKRVLLVGLWGTAFSCLGLAFSQSFLATVLFRLLGGALNGTVGIIRTMISENINERKHQSHAFSLLPASFMVASVIGPVCGSLLADPVTTYPHLFEEDLDFGITPGTRWLVKYPYALPALLSAFSMAFIGIVVFLTIEETLEIRRTRSDIGLELGSILRHLLRGSGLRSVERYSLVQNDEIGSEDIEVEMGETKTQTLHLQQKATLSFRKVWTSHVITTLSAQAIFDFHMGAFGSLLPLFLSTPRSLNSTYPFIFSGGLGMKAQSVGIALAILGFVGIVLQFLVYPRVNGRLGNVQCFRIFCMVFPLAYGLAPFLAVIPAGRTFVLPVTIVLLNNCAPDPSVLGLIHGIGQTTSALFRTLGPVFAGLLFGSSLEHGVSSAVWWALAAVAILGWVASLFVLELPA